MILFKNVSKRFPNKREALSNLNFLIKPAEMVFLTGHSGAGKTTILKLIAKLESVSGGQIIVNGYDLNQIQAKQIPYFRRRLGIITQNPNLLMDRSVFENVALALDIAHFRNNETEKRVRAALRKVGLLERERCYPETLSAGEQQRVGIARAIVHRPSLVLADEPTGNLDPELAREIMNLFASLNQVGVSVLIASHDLDLIESLPYRRLILSEGKLIHDSRIKTDNELCVDLIAEDADAV